MEHYFSEKQSSPFKLKKIHFSLGGQDFYFYTAPGVFSRTRIDKGSTFLVKTATIKDNWKVLDLGCGYGPVGIIIKKLNPKAEVWLSDVNERAIKLTLMNAELNKVDVKVLKSNSFENLNAYFDTILFNPPQAAGLKLCFKMVEDSYNHLKDGGMLQLVARQNTGGRRFEKLMLELFGNVEPIRGHKEFSRYTVYKATKEKRMLFDSKELTFWNRKF